MPIRPMSDSQKTILNSNIVDDLTQFFKDNYVDVIKVVQHGNSDSVKFYEIHFNHDSKFDVDLIPKLDKFGYIPKSFHSNVFGAFHLLVVVNKKIWL